MYIHCPSGNVKELIMELIFEGLATLHAKDKTVCFLHPLDFNQQARKRTDMPVKFQKIHEEWACFNQVIGRFKNDIKEGKTCTYNVSLWLGSDKELKKLINSCTLQWEEARANGGVVKVQYKKMQSLHTSRHFILVGVPTDIDSDSLQTIMETKMEEAQAKMVKKNPSKYGAIRRVPGLTLIADFIKNTPFAECSDKDDIPFWAKMPYHIECFAILEDKIEAILAFMYCIKQFQGLFGEAAFYFKNLGLEASAGERTVLARVLTHHIAMVWLMSRIILKGLIHLDRQFPL
jgi:hypothetical protein